MVLNKLKSLQYHMGVRGPQLLKGTVRGNGVCAYWYRDLVNFGDIITPLLLNYYGFTPIHTMPKKADLVSTGSVLEHLPELYSGHILGSGFIDEKSQMDFPNANILSVRGKLSRERLSHMHKDIKLGDPGLLASSILKERQTKKYVLGIVPHHNHVDISKVLGLATKEPEDITVIDVKKQPLDVFKLIDQCQYILSSSLHGLIVADSFNIPNAWMATNGLIGGRFKFDDYYSSLEVSAGNPLVINGKESLNEILTIMMNKPADRVQELQTANHELWSNLSKVLRQS